MPEINKYQPATSTKENKSLVTRKAYPQIKQLALNPPVNYADMICLLFDLLADSVI